MNLTASMGPGFRFFRLFAAAITVGTAVAVGCGGDSPGAQTGGSAGGDGGGFPGGTAGSSGLPGTDGVNGPAAGPPPPEIGQQIDRVGRDGIGHAVADPFGLMELFSHQIRDAYNRAGDRAQWPALFAARFRSALGIWDGTDGTCGNQLSAGPAAQPGRYDALVDLLVDDVLLVDTARATCTTYLGVELRALGGAANDCGGRTPIMDTPDILMTYLASGLGGRNADGTMAVTDGIATDKDGAPSMADFPFLLAAGTGTPGSSTGGAVDPEQGYLVCANLAETRCARVYQCWGRDNVPAEARDAYAFDASECTRRLTAECRGLSTASYGPRCPAGTLFDPGKLRACERTYSLATCDEIKAVGTGMLSCGSVCVE